jgi:hypothetical protein
MNGNTAYLIHHSKAKWRVAVRFPPLFLPNMKKVLFFCKMRFYKGASATGAMPRQIREYTMTEVFTAKQNEFMQRVFREEYVREMSAAENAKTNAEAEFHYNRANQAFNMQAVVANHSEF